MNACNWSRIAKLAIMFGKAESAVMFSFRIFLYRYFYSKGVKEFKWQLTSGSGKHAPWWATVGAE